MIKWFRIAVLLSFFFASVPGISQRVDESFQTNRWAYLGQVSLGYGFYLNGGDLLHTGFEGRALCFLNEHLAWGGGLAYTQFKPLEGLYGLALLSDFRWFPGAADRRWRFFGNVDVGLGAGGSRLHAGWSMHRPGLRTYAGGGFALRSSGTFRYTLECGYLYQNVQYRDNTPGRGWQVFQTESVMKYHFRRLQIKAGLLF